MSSDSQAPATSASASGSASATASAATSGPYTKRQKYSTLAAVLMGWAFDGFDLMIVAFMIPDIVKDLGITEVDFSIMILMPMLAVTALGGVLFGALADKWGRRLTLNITIVIYSLATGAAFFTPAGFNGVIFLSVCRIISGLGIGGEWAAGYTLLSEVWGPTKRRGLMGGLVHGFFGVGVVMAAYLTAFFIPFGWRVVFGVGAFPALFVLFIRIWVPESKMWLEYRDKKAKGELPEYLKKVTKRAPVSQIFDGEFRKITIRATLLATAGLFIYYIVTSWLPTYLSTPISERGLGYEQFEIAWTFSAMAMVALPACVAGGWMSDKIGRRKAFFIWVIIGLLGMLTFWYAVNVASGNHDIIFAAILVYAAGLGFFGVYGVWFMELYPTRIRTTGSAFCFNIGRGVAATAPVFIAILAIVYGLGGAISFATVAYVAMLIIIWFIPETKGRDMKAVDYDYEKSQEEKRKMLAKKREFPALPTAIIAIGVVLILIVYTGALEPVLPIVKKAPEELNKKIDYEGTFVFFNSDNLEDEHYNVTVLEYINSTSFDDEKLYLTYKQNLYNHATDRPMEEYVDEYDPIDEEFAINRKTLAYASANYTGQFSFPIGVEKKSYDLWNRDINATSEARFIKEELKDGLLTYVYRFEEQSLPIELAEELAEDVPDAQQLYNTTTTLWVEPLTGSLVAVEKSRTENVVMPNLRRLPHDLDIGRDFTGTLMKLNESTVLYETYDVLVNVTVKVEELVGNNATLKLEDITKVLELQNGIIAQELTDHRDEAKYGVDRYTAQYEAIPDYGYEYSGRSEKQSPLEREGLMTFPIGQVRDATGQPVSEFDLWNTDMGKIFTAKFARETTVPGLSYPVYLYEMTVTNESKTLRDFLEKEPHETIPDALVTYEATFMYYVDPFTGMVIDMERDVTWNLKPPSFAELFYSLEINATLEGTYDIYDLATANEDDYVRYEALGRQTLIPKLDYDLFITEGRGDYFENLTVTDKATGVVLDSVESEPLVQLSDHSMERLKPATGEYLAHWRFPPNAVNPPPEGYKMFVSDLRSMEYAYPFDLTGDPLIYKIDFENYRYFPDPEMELTPPYIEKYADVSVTMEVNKTTGFILDLEKDVTLYIKNLSQPGTDKVKVKHIQMHLSEDAKEKSLQGAFIFTAALRNTTPPLAIIKIEYNNDTYDYIITDVLDKVGNPAKGGKIDYLSNKTVQLLSLNVEYSHEYFEEAHQDAKEKKSSLLFVEVYAPYAFVGLGVICIGVSGLVMILKVIKKRKGQQIEEFSEYEE